MGVRAEDAAVRFNMHVRLFRNAVSGEVDNPASLLGELRQEPTRRPVSRHRRKDQEHRVDTVEGSGQRPWIREVTTDNLDALTQSRRRGSWIAGQRAHRHTSPGQLRNHLPSDPAGRSRH